MNPNQQPEHDAALDRLLQEWVLQQPLPPRFQENVWSQIRQTEVRPEVSLWASVARILEVLLARPKVAYSYVSLLLVIGVVFGAWEAQRQNSRLESSLSSRYLQAVDPFRAAPSNR